MRGSGSDAGSAVRPGGRSVLKALDRSWEGRTAWCVPSAFAILTGCTLASAHSKFAFAEDVALADLKGVGIEYLIGALGAEGKRCTPVDLMARYPDHAYGPTIQRYMAERPFGPERTSPLLLLLPSHVVTAHMDWMADNWTKRPVPVDRFPKLMRTVQRAWVIT